MSVPDAEHPVLPFREEGKEIMKNHIKIILAAGLMIAGLGAPGFAMARSGKTSDDAAKHQAFLASKVTVAAAAAAAEAKTGARAMSVEFERERGAFVYEVKLLTKDSKELEALIDPNTAAVISVGDDDSDSD